MQVTSDPRNRQYIHPAGDPQVGNLATPINASNLVQSLIQNLPAYRQELSPWRRGLEIGMAHGYWLIGPFAKLGPLRDSNVANLAGLLSTVGLIVIASACLVLYAASRPPAPLATITNPQPSGLESTQGWSEFAKGFLIGGVGGAGFAYFLLAIIAFLR